MVPLAPPPFNEMPACVIDPSFRPTRVLQPAPVQYPPPGPPTGGGFRGSRFGMTHGLTHRGCTGVMVPVGPLPTVPELEGLKASAVAVALTLLPVFPQMREKNVGMLGRFT